MAYRTLCSDCAKVGDKCEGCGQLARGSEASRQVLEVGNASATTVTADNAAIDDDDVHSEADMQMEERSEEEEVKDSAGQSQQG